jgi:hypothetical protein
MLIAGVGLAMLVVVPLVWGLVRKHEGLPMFGTPTVSELEQPTAANQGTTEVTSAGQPPRGTARAGNTP